MKKSRFSTNISLCLDQSRLDDLRNKLSPLPSQYTVEIEEVRSLLSKVKLNKSVGPDGISHKIIKELANFLAAPVTSIINSSLHQGTVPDQWKISRITSVPKIFPTKHVESDLLQLQMLLQKLLRSLLAATLMTVWKCSWSFNYSCSFESHA